MNDVAIIEPTPHNKDKLLFTKQRILFVTCVDCNLLYVNTCYKYSLFYKQRVFFIVWCWYNHRNVVIKKSHEKFKLSSGFLSFYLHNIIKFPIIKAAVM